MARRRYQKGSLRVRGKVWTLRWREDVVLADGTVKRVQRTTVLGTTEEFGTRRLAEREAEAVLARVNRLDYRPVKRATFAEFAERWKSQVVELLAFDGKGRGIASALPSCPDVRSHEAG